MQRIALLVGLLISLQGVVGLILPEQFVLIVRFFQVPPVIYLAAAIRLAIGIVLMRAAPASRSPIGLLLMGALIAIGGAVTPFFGTEIARIILDWWTEGGPMLVRACALGSLAIGGFIVYAVRASPSK